MHTTTSKQILEPLAEAVTQLILIISDAEINRTPIPDLSELARVVDDQVVNLVGVGTRIQNQSSADEQLKADMPKACAEVTTASRRLLGATGELVMDAFSKHGRQELLEAVKGILSGTTAVLRAFDDSEVRKILTVSRNLKSKIAKLSSSPSSTSTDPNAAQQIVTLMMQISQTVVTLAQITNKRVGELLQPILQTRLKIAIAGLTKESPLLITATKFVLQKPGSGEALRAREQSCQRVVEACVEIETVVQIKEVGESLIAQAVKDDFGKLSKKLEEQKLKLMAAISNKDPKAAMAALVEYKQVADDLLKLASAIAQQVNDPAQKAQIEILIDAVTKDRDNLEKLTEDLLKNPDDPVLQKRLADQFNHIASTLDALKNALNAALVGEMVTTFGKLSDYQQLSPEPTVLGKLHQAAVNGDKDALANAAEDFGNTNKYLQDLVGSAIKMANDENPEMSQHLKLHANRLDQLAPSVVAAAEGLAANPKDETAKQVHKNVMDMWEDGVKEMQNVTIGQEGVFKTGDIIAGAANALNHHMDEMNKAIADGDGKKASSVASDLVSAAKQYLSIAKKEAENTSDAAFKMELEAKILEVERVIPDLLSKAKYFAETQALGGIFSDEDQNALRDIVKNITSKMSDLGHIICKNRGIELPNTQAPPPLPVEELKPVVEEKKPEPVEAAKEEVAPVVVEKAPEPVVELPDDVVVVEEEAPKPLSAEEAKENPIKAAAQELKVEVSQWASSENPIVEAASLISKYLDALSRHHKALLTNPTPEAKRDFIRAAQDIMAQGLAIVEPVKKLAESCTDLRLRRQLLGTIDRVTTLAQQLKIVAAVKASAPRDTDRDHVLIACAQNLMQAVKTCLRESEAASLRTGPQPVRSQDKTKGSTPVKSDVAAKVAPFKFKRQVFKGVAVPGRMTQVN